MIEKNLSSKISRYLLYGSVAIDELNNYRTFIECNNATNNVSMT